MSESSSSSFYNYKNTNLGVERCRILNLDDLFSDAVGGELKAVVEVSSGVFVAPAAGQGQGQGPGQGQT